MTLVEGYGSMLHLWQHIERGLLSLATVEALRLEAGLSQAALARAAKVDRLTVVRAETGEPIQDTKAYAIAKALSDALGRRINFRELDGLVVI
jgi:transcriptional regulator with XRE-family HTH domain